MNSAIFAICLILFVSAVVLFLTGFLMLLKARRLHRDVEIHWKALEISCAKLRKDTYEMMRKNPAIAHFAPENQ